MAARPGSWRAPRAAIIDDAGDAALYTAALAAGQVEVDALHRTADFEAAIAGDRAWFRARPWRRFRLRQASPSEVRIFALLDQGTRSGDPTRLWVIVRQIARGERTRQALDLVLDGDCELPQNDREIATLARLIAAGRPVLVHDGRALDLALAAGAAGGQA